MFSVSLFENHE